MVNSVIDFIFEQFTLLFSLCASNWPFAFILLISLISLIISLITAVRNK